MSTDDGQLSAFRQRGVHRFAWLAVTLLGSIIGFFINLYVDEVREMIEWGWSRLAVQWLMFFLILLGCGYATWRLAAWSFSRRFSREQIEERAFVIRTADFDDDLPADQAVIGRTLRYLERKRDTPYIVVCLHGLGLDANDFRPFMQMTRQHVVAVTLFGFNQDEATDQNYRPIGLTTHAELLSGAINNLQRRYPSKKVVLVGFSLGADMQLRLGELWRDHPERRPRIEAMLLLDPNINHSTMVVSEGVTTLNAADPLQELKAIANMPVTLVQFQNICEYLHKIAGKNLRQIRQHASDMWNYWEPEGNYALFLQRVNNLRSFCQRVMVVFSTHYEEHFNEIVAHARQRGLDREMFVVERQDHFALLDDRFLSVMVDSMIGTRR